MLEERFRALEGDRGAIGVVAVGTWPRCTLMTSLLPLSRNVGGGWFCAEAVPAMSTTMTDPATVQVLINLESAFAT